MDDEVFQGFISTINSTTEKMKNGTATPADFLENAKAIMNLTDDPDNQQFLNNFGHSVIDATKGIQSIDDACKMEAELQQSWYEWRERLLKSKLSEIALHPENDTLYNQYIHYKPTVFHFLFTYQTLIFGPNADPHVKEIVGTMGKDDLSAYRNSFTDKVIDPYPSEEQESNECSVGVNIFNAARSVFEENKNGNTDFVLAIGTATRARLIRAYLLIKGAIPKEEDDNKNDPNIVISRLMSLAEVIDYELSANMYPNGKALSLYPTEDYRKTLYNELLKIYQRIKKLDPNYTSPPMPNMYVTNNQSSGCYVATAVYGSYDCPQVWTLRRYRDYTLAETWYGRAFIRTYYAVSPTLVKWFGQTDWFKAMWKPKLDRMVQRLNADGIADTPYQDKQW